MNLVHSAKSTACSTLSKYKQYGWKQIDEQIVINWGSMDQILASSQAGCGCHGGCDTNRCSCHSAGRQCTHACKCTNCFNHCSIASSQQKPKTTTTVVATAEGETSDDDDTTDDSEREKVEEEIAPLNNDEIMEWEDCIC